MDKAQFFSLFITSIAALTSQSGPDSYIFDELAEGFEELVGEQQKVNQEEEEKIDVEN